MTAIDNFMSAYPSLCQTERIRKLAGGNGHSGVHYFLVFVVATLSLLFFVGGSKLVSDLFGFVYPSYMSFKAVDSADPNDDTQWLTYV